MQVKLRVSLVVLLALVATPARASWVRANSNSVWDFTVGGGAVCYTLAVLDASGRGVSDGRVLCSMGGSFSDTMFSEPPAWARGRAQSVALGIRSTWVVSSDGWLYFASNGNWSRVINLGVQDVANGLVEDIVFQHATGQLWVLYRNQAFILVGNSLQFTMGGIAHLSSGGARNEMWATKQDGTIWRYTTSSWHRVSGGVALNTSWSATGGKYAVWFGNLTSTPAASCSSPKWFPTAADAFYEYGSFDFIAHRAWTDELYRIEQECRNGEQPVRKMAEGSGGPTGWGGPHAVGKNDLVWVLLENTHLYSYEQ